MFLLLRLLQLLSMAIDVVIIGLIGLDETQARRGNGSTLLCRSPGAEETFLLEKMAPETRDGIRLPGRQRYCG